MQHTHVEVDTGVLDQTIPFDLIISSTQCPHAGRDTTAFKTVRALCESLSWDSLRCTYCDEVPTAKQRLAAYTLVTIAPVVLGYLTCWSVQAQLHDASPYAGRVLVTWAHMRRPRAVRPTRPSQHTCACDCQDANLEFLLRVGFGVNTTAYKAPLDTQLHIVLQSRHTTLSALR